MVRKEPRMARRGVITPEPKEATSVPVWVVTLVVVVSLLAVIVAGFSVFLVLS